MEYLKIFTDFARSIEPLDDAERGRLFSAMLAYAESGQITDLPGNERFLWPTARLHIDREAEYLEDRRRCGTLGGRPKKSAEKQTKASESCEKVAKGSKTQKDKDKEKEKDKDKIVTSSPGGEDVARPRGSYANVFLTDRELMTFRTEYRDAEQFIEQMGEYMASTGKSYENHLAALRRWARKAEEDRHRKNPAPAPPQRDNSWMRQYIKP